MIVLIDFSFFSFLFSCRLVEVFDASHASKRNQARPSIRQVLFEVENKLSKKIFSFKIIGKEDKQLNFFSVENNSPSLEYFISRT